MTILIACRDTSMIRRHCLCRVLSVHRPRSQHGLGVFFISEERLNVSQNLIIRKLVSR